MPRHARRRVQGSRRLVQRGRYVRGRGFTLLEVLLALTICGIAFAALFGVIAGSRQLTFRAQGVLTESDAIRRFATRSLLVDESGELLVPDDRSDYRFNPEAEELEAPERKTAATTETIRLYEIEDADGELLYQGSFWVTLEEAE